MSNRSDRAHASTHRRGTLGVLVVALVCGSVAGCVAQEQDREGAGAFAREEEDSGELGVVHLYEWVARAPTAEGLEYLRALAEHHARADVATPPQATSELERALARALPKDCHEAVVARLETMSRWAEFELMSGPPGAERVLERFDAEFGEAPTLPIDPAAAHVMVVWGDAADAVGQHRRAVSAYARALTVMSAVRQKWMHDLELDDAPLPSSPATPGAPGLDAPGPKGQEDAR